MEYGDKAGQARSTPVHRVMQEGCGITEGVWPVVVFVGNWQVADQWESTDARVFTPAALLEYIQVADQCESTNARVFTQPLCWSTSAGSSRADRQRDRSDCKSSREQRGLSKARNADEQKARGNAGFSWRFCWGELPRSA